MSKIQLVVFDMAGTTVKDANEVQACFSTAAQATGLTAEPEQINAMMGCPSGWYLRPSGNSKSGLIIPTILSRSMHLMPISARL